MPKVKSYKTRNPGERVLDVMAYHQYRLELSHKEWALKISIPYTTLLRREKRPDTFTIGELIRIAAACEVPLNMLIIGQVDKL